MNFDVWVIHGRRLRQRKADCLARLERLGWAARWMEDHDPADLGIGYWVRRVRNITLTWGEISVYAKQAAVLAAVAQSSRPALVIEDDAIVDEHFARTVDTYFAALPAGWDFAFLGASCGLELSASAETPHFAAADRTRSMSGYLVTPEAAQRVATDLARQPIREPIDLALNSLLRKRPMRVFWSVPSLIPNGSEQRVYPRSVEGGAWRALNPRRWLR